MKASCYVILAVLLLGFALSASAREVVLPAGTLLQCTLNEPNFSSATADVGDPVLCHLRAQTEFGQQAFPRGSYLVGHLESAKNPGHFWGKGNLKLQFDRIGLPSGDLPLEAKVIATRGYKVDKQGRIDGKGHAVRDIVEWMIPPLWPWKVIMLPARGPRPALKGETQLSLRLMDDVDIPQVAQNYSPKWQFFGHVQNQSYDDWRPSTLHPRITVHASASVELSSRNAGENSYANPSPTSAYYASPTSPIDASPTYASYVTRDVALPAHLTSAPGMPVFVLNTGSMLAVSGYGYSDNRITYSLVGGGSGVISTSDVDWQTTTRLNAQRGVRVTLHGGKISQEAAQGF